MLPRLAFDRPKGPEPKLALSSELQTRGSPAALLPVDPKRWGSEAIRIADLRGDDAGAAVTNRWPVRSVRSGDRCYGFRLLRGVIDWATQLALLEVRGRRGLPRMEH